MSSNNSRLQKQEYYRKKGSNGNQSNNERYYCSVCNAWMGSDKMSIATHNSGKKHVDKVAAAAALKRQQQKEAEQFQQKMLQSLQRMEQAAVLQFQQQDYGVYYCQNYNNSNDNYYPTMSLGVANTSTERTSNTPSTVLEQYPLTSYFPAPHHIPPTTKRDDYEARRFSQERNPNNKSMQSESDGPFAGGTKRPKLEMVTSDDIYHNPFSATAENNNQATAGDGNHSGHYDVEEEIFEPMDDDKSGDECSKTDKQFEHCKTVDSLEENGETLPAFSSNIATDTTATKTDESIKEKEDADDHRIRHNGIKIEKNNNNQFTSGLKHDLERHYTQLLNHKDIETIESTTIGSSSMKLVATLKKRRRKSVLVVRTYLDGIVYGETILQPDMPIQLWIGSIHASSAEKRLPYNQHLWADAIVIQVRRIRKQVLEPDVILDKPTQQFGKINDAKQQQSFSSNTLVSVVDVAYLKKKFEIEQHSRTKLVSKQDSENNIVFDDGDATTTNCTNEARSCENDMDQNIEEDEEVIEKSVQMDRIRIQLNNHHDARIPQTLEQARIIAMGGEEIITIEPPDNPAAERHRADIKRQQQQNQTKAVDFVSSDVHSTTRAEDDNDDDSMGGLTSWSTVQIKRTAMLPKGSIENSATILDHNIQTVRSWRQALNDENQRLEIARQKEVNMQKLEMARIEGYDNDSALGAYDVWNRGAKEGYKGVRIDSGDDNLVTSEKAISATTTVSSAVTKIGSSAKSTTTAPTIHDVMGKKLSTLLLPSTIPANNTNPTEEVQKVEFKGSKTFSNTFGGTTNMKKQKQKIKNRRKTSADD